MASSQNCDIPYSHSEEKERWKMSFKNLFLDGLDKKIDRKGMIAITLACIAGGIICMGRLGFAP